MTYRCALGNQTHKQKYYLIDVLAFFFFLFFFCLGPALNNYNFTFCYPKYFLTILELSYTQYADGVFIQYLQLILSFVSVGSQLLQEK